MGGGGGNQGGQLPPQALLGTHRYHTRNWDTWKSRHKHHKSTTHMHGHQYTYSELHDFDSMANDTENDAMVYRRFWGRFVKWRFPLLRSSQHAVGDG